MDEDKLYGSGLRLTLIQVLKETGQNMTHKQLFEAVNIYELRHKKAALANRIYNALGILYETGKITRETLKKNGTNINQYIYTLL